MKSRFLWLGAKVLCILLLAAGCNSESSPTVEQSSSQGVSGSTSTTAPHPPSAPPSIPIGQNGEGTDQAYIRSAEIFPNPITLDKPVQVVVDALDPKGGAVTFTHQWIVNGELLEGETKPQLDPNVLHRGDLVSVKLTPMSSQVPGVPFHAKEVSVGNTLPKVTSLTIQPFPAKVGQELTPQVEVVDLDQDEVTLFYRWKHNGTIVLEGDPQPFNLTEAHRGDEIELEVIPKDLTGSGEPFTSKKITISNSPPEITSTPPTAIHNSLYLYSVTAIDLDGDSLEFGLKDPPAKMTIHPKTGKLQWSLTPDMAGQHTITVTVSDGQEDEPVEQEFDITINSQEVEANG